MHSNYRVKFDGSALIKHFGNINDAVDALRTAGIEVKPKTLEKQRQRGNMPADMVASMLVASKNIGRPIDPYVYLIGEK